jgi:hypothetical protein
MDINIDLLKISQIESPPPYFGFWCNKYLEQIRFLAMIIG